MLFGSEVDLLKDYGVPPHPHLHPLTPSLLTPPTPSTHPFWKPAKHCGFGGKWPHTIVLHDFELMVLTSEDRIDSHSNSNFPCQKKNNVKFVKLPPKWGDPFNQVAVCSPSGVCGVATFLWLCIKLNYFRLLLAQYHYTVTILIGETQSSCSSGTKEEDRLEV